MTENSREITKRVIEYQRLLIKSKQGTRATVKWRKEHGGMLPKEVWLNTLEAGGSYSCVEIVPYDLKTGTIYLKKRNDPSASGGEKEWKGKLHIPGISELASIRGEEILPKLLRNEILKNPDDAVNAVKDMRFLTQGRYPEPERKTIADTLVLLLPVHADMLQSDFFPVTQDNIDEVIEQHRPIIKKYWEGNMPLILDTRKR